MGQYRNLLRRCHDDDSGDDRSENNFSKAMARCRPLVDLPWSSRATDREAIVPTDALAERDSMPAAVDHTNEYAEVLEKPA